MLLLGTSQKSKLRQKLAYLSQTRVIGWSTVSIYVLLFSTIDLGDVGNGEDFSRKATFKLTQCIELSMIL